MSTLSVIGLSICLVFISIFMQGTEAQDCAACRTTFTSSITNALQDKERICYAVNIFLTCLDDDCDASVSKIIIDAGKKAASQYGCGAGSILVNLTVIGLGLTSYMLA
ncbi:uncharacterized protein LOC127705829 [Mytilus californianus]|uniref:uncharacterized protein LOC127705829 n=1 Tax=Mytilus californianus TaxID=6549 RepID=UPI00224536A9|nr:uncharacterized protein LOC127705829 [Mytilus californianus]